eukprot:TRINITY_DN22033_c0_g1_i1.p1 TRINITY_DN22033_c0_g1~~TRINITY_DN22033_c0_g1_i1.p1  ORF type:complete len:148 (+),score=38.68 TRINITY_DN22033_c0_g1_i1:265-708(+)
MFAYLGDVPLVEQESFLESLGTRKDLISRHLRPLYCEKTLNNYKLINYYGEGDTIRGASKTYAAVQEQNPVEKVNLHQIFDFMKLDWKVEVTISSSLVSKVLRPLILLKFHSKQGRVFTLYVDLVQFQELRFAAAEALKQIHQIEAI